MQKNTETTKVKLLDPKIDAVFQILFSKSNPEVIKGLISAILNMPILKNNDVALNNGKRLGYEEAKKEFAQKLLLLKIPTNQIIEITGLSLEEIKNISNQGH